MKRELRMSMFARCGLLTALIAIAFLSCSKDSTNFTDGGGGGGGSDDDVISIDPNFAAFTTTWDDTNTVTIPMNSELEYAYEVNWGDGTTEIVTDANDVVSHSFTNNGPHTVEIRGEFPAIQFGVAGDGGAVEPFDTNIVDKIVAVNQWGDVAWESMDMAFAFCTNLNIPGDITPPNLSGVTDMSEMFVNATDATPNVTNWDVNTVNSMARMFANTSSANPNVTNWNVNNATNMAAMFMNAEKANPNMSKWNINTNETLDMSEMLDNSGIDRERYTDALLRFAAQVRNLGIGGRHNAILGAEGIKFCDLEGAATAKTDLELRGWDIKDGGGECCDGFGGFVCDVGGGGGIIPGIPGGGIPGFPF